MAADQSGDKRFVVFDAPRWGIRAGIQIWRAYEERGLDTIEEIVRVYAPSVENDTEAYIRAIERKLGVDRSSHIDIEDPLVCLEMLRAFVYHENGQDPYTESVYLSGMALAGVIHPKWEGKAEEPKPLKKSRTIAGNTITAGATAAGAGASLLGGLDLSEGSNVALKWMPHLQALGDIAPWFLGAAGLGIGLVYFARWDDRRKGRL